MHDGASLCSVLAACWESSDMLPLLSWTLQAVDIFVAYMPVRNVVDKHAAFPDGRGCSSM